jgi:hypothetical protein
MFINFQEVEIEKAPAKKSGKFGKRPTVGNGSLMRAGSTASAGGQGSVSPSSAPSESATAVLDYFHNATVQGAQIF